MSSTVLVWCLRVDGFTVSEVVRASEFDYMGFCRGVVGALVYAGARKLRT